MSKGKELGAICAVAFKNGVSIGDALKEMEEAIDRGRSCCNPQAQNFWSGVPCQGRVPTPEEVIAYLAGLAEKQ